MWNFDSFSRNIALLSDDGIEVSYSVLQSECEKMREIISEKSLVFCLCSNTIGSVVGYVSFISNGIVPILLNQSIERGLLNNLLNIYKPNYIWSPINIDHEGDVLYSSNGYELVKVSNYNHKFHKELALLLTTSGSTGSAKLVRQSYKNIKVNAEQIVRYLNISESERPVTTLPMNYTYGLSIINSHLLAGATILLTDKTIMQREFWRFLKDYQATSFGGVPYTYEMLDKLRFMRMDLPYLRYMTQAGGKLSPDLHKKFAEYAESAQKKFIVMYGQCEATARMSYLPAEDSIRKYGYIGIPVPGGRFELIDGDGVIVDEPNTPGELVYYGENVTWGYADKPEDFLLDDERKGRLETGDIAVFDEDGFYKIVGRKNRFLKVYGNRVNLDEIDGLIEEYYSNINTVAAGYDDKVFIFVEKTEDISINYEKIIRYLAEKTKLNSAAFHVEMIDSIPRNDSGKILYRELEKYYGLQ